MTPPASALVVVLVDDVAADPPVPLVVLVPAVVPVEFELLPVAVLPRPPPPPPLAEDVPPLVEDDGASE